MGFLFYYDYYSLRSVPPFAVRSRVGRGDGSHSKNVGAIHRHERDLGDFAPLYTAAQQH